jgi:phosphomannomutase
MVSVSGIRGTIPNGLTPPILADAVTAFGAITGKKIVIGMDSRSTGPWIRDLTTAVLVACGKEVLHAGLAPTPTVKAAVKMRRAHGAIMISASHNPPEWNGLKLMGPEGFFFNKQNLQQLNAALDGGKFQLADYRTFGKVQEIDAITDHVQAVIALLQNREQIKACKFRVVVDAVGGAGRNALPALLAELGCEVIPIFCDPPRSGDFPRPPEPTPTALKEFSTALKKTGASCGFALDPDADRIVPGTPRQGAINEEYSLPLAFLGLPDVPVAPGKSTRKKNHSIVVNLSTATLIDQTAAPYGYTVIRSAVGEANVVEMMRKNHALFGGEGNGGIIHARVPSFGRDSLLGAALILSAMAKHGCKTLDDLMEKMPPLYMEKKKFALKPGQDPREVFHKIENTLAGMNANRRDGLHLSNHDSWIHVRASNTEPIIRVIAEAKSKAALEQLLARAGRSMR